MSELLRELEVVTELIKKCIAENSSSSQDQEKYTERYNNYVDRYEKAKSRYNEHEHQKENKLSKRKAIDRFISDLSERDELLTEYAFTTIRSAYGFSAFKFVLNSIPLHRVNNGFV